MAKSIVPKGCIVHSVNIGKRSTEVRYRCKRDGSSFYETGSNWYPDGKGGGSNYPSKRLKGIRSVSLPGGLGVSGDGASVHGFMKCRRERSEISCTPV